MLLLTQHDPHQFRFWNLAHGTDGSMTGSQRFSDFVLTWATGLSPCSMKPVMMLWEGDRQKILIQIKDECTPGKNHHLVNICWHSLCLKHSTLLSLLLLYLFPCIVQQDRFHYEQSKLVIFLKEQIKQLSMQFNVTFE